MIDPVGHQRQGKGVTAEDSKSASSRLVESPGHVRHGISPRIMGRIYRGVCNDIIESRNNDVRNIFRRVKRDVEAEDMSDTWGLELVVGSSARGFPRVFGNSEVV